MLYEIHGILRLQENSFQEKFYLKVRKIPLTEKTVNVFRERGEQPEYSLFWLSGSNCFGNKIEYFRLIVF